MNGSCRGSIVIAVGSLMASRKSNDAGGESDDMTTVTNPFMDRYEEDSRSGEQSSGAITKATKYKQPYDANLYTTKQTIGLGLMELALLTTNAVQMRNVVESGKDRPFYMLCLLCVSSSLVVQLVVGVLLILNGRYNVNRWAEEHKADLLCDTIFVCIFFITIANVFFSTFRT
ncbi:Uncharacterised protein g3959 [Pycnogonum litorale]